MTAGGAGAPCRGAARRGAGGDKAAWRHPRRHGDGGRGIRTHETLAGLAVFKTAAFNRSASPPEGEKIVLPGVGCHAAKPDGDRITAMSDYGDLAQRLAAALSPNYVLDGVLGAGGCAVVWGARDVRSGREVAVKTLKPEVDSVVLRERFRREGEAAARLTHPNVIRIHDVGERDGLAWIVMAREPGPSLAARVKAHGPLPPDDAARFLGEVASALGAAHRAGVVHRDVKGDNVLLAGDGRAILTDFGIAKLLDGLDESLTSTGVVVGTPAAMAPEQLAGDAPVDARTDVWALGVLGYELLTGTPPFTAPTMAQLVGQIIAGEPAPFRSHGVHPPAWLEGVIARCLRKEAAARYADANEVAAALGAGGASAADTRPEVPAAADPDRRVLGAIAGAVLGVAALEMTTGAVRFTPVAVLAGGLGVALSVMHARWRVQVQAAVPSATRPQTMPIDRLRTERRLVAALLLQMPKTERARFGGIVGALDDAVAEADRAARLAPASMRSAMPSLLSTARAAREALERRALDEVATALTSLAGATQVVRRVATPTA